jgi:hypothetical protein
VVSTVEPCRRNLSNSPSASRLSGVASAKTEALPRDLVLPELFYKLRTINYKLLRQLAESNLLNIVERFVLVFEYFGAVFERFYTIFERF